jgi:hypothetical protein
MRLFLIILLTVLSQAYVIAQNDRDFRINSVQSDSNRLYRSAYRYPRFTRGYILFKNDQIASALLNYNRLSGQILFISPKGDTLEPADPRDIRHVAIGSDTFHYFEKGYVELITHYPGINLFKKQTIQYNGKEKKGAYGAYSSATAANSIDKVADNHAIEKIGVDENDLYATETRYYLAGASGSLITAGKKGFRKLFPGKQKELEDYLSGNRISFSRQEDLIKLLEYLQK